MNSNKTRSLSGMTDFCCK